MGSVGLFDPGPGSAVVGSFVVGSGLVYKNDMMDMIFKNMA